MVQSSASDVWTFGRCVSSERGINVSNITINRWVILCVPEFEKRWNRFARPVNGPLGGLAQPQDGQTDPYCDIWLFRLMRSGLDPRVEHSNAGPFEVTGITQDDRRLRISDPNPVFNPSFLGRLPARPLAHDAQKHRRIARVPLRSFQARGHARAKLKLSVQLPRV
jgi:hypothetical protein